MNSSSANEPPQGPEIEYIVPDRIEPVLAWRVWEVDEEGRVCSITQQHTWDEKYAEVAVCLKHKDDDQHTPPVWGCLCGFHGYDNRRGACNHAEAALCSPTPTPMVAYGLVELWGDTITHSTGFRAQHAAIVEMWVQTRTGSRRKARRVAQAVSERYGIPCHSAPRLALTTRRVAGLISTGFLFALLGATLGAYVHSTIGPMIGLLLGFNAGLSVYLLARGCEKEQRRELRSIRWPLTTILLLASSILLAQNLIH